MYRYSNSLFTNNIMTFLYLPFIKKCICLSDKIFIFVRPVYLNVIAMVHEHNIQYKVP